MRLFHRYIFYSIALSITFAVGIFTFIILAANILRDIAELLAAGQLTLAGFSQLLLLLLPYILVFSLPMGLLCGVLLTLGRLSSQNEITAFRSIGMSYGSISAPIIVLAIAITFLSLLINTQIAPKMRTQFKETKAQLVRANPINFLQEKTFITEFEEFVIYIGQREGTNMRDFWLWQLNDKKQAVALVQAEKGEFTYDREQDALILTLQDGTGEKRSERNPEDFMNPNVPTLNFKTISFTLPLAEIFGSASVRIKPSMMTLQQLQEKIASLPEDQISERMIYQMQVQKHFAWAFSAISLCLIGIPLAIQVGRKEVFANFALALGLAMLYYLSFTLIGLLEEKPALRPDLLIWIPNLAFQALGFFWMKKKFN